MAAATRIEREVKLGGIIVFLIPNSKYGKKLNEIVASSSRNSEGLCYVSLNKPYDTLMPMFRSIGVDVKKMVFIDCIKYGFGNADGGMKVVFVSSPKALTEMDIAIKKVLDGEKVSVLVFDSLSTLLVYDEPSTVIKFSHSIISKLRAAGVGGVFLCLSGDVKSELIKDLSMFADRIVEVR